MAVRSATFERGGVDRQLQCEVSEDLFDRPGQATPARNDRSDAEKPLVRAFAGPWRARQFDRRGKKAMRWTAAQLIICRGARGYEVSMSQGSPR